MVVNLRLKDRMKQIEGELVWLKEADERRRHDMSVLISKILPERSAERGSSGLSLGHWMQQRQEHSSKQQEEWSQDTLKVTKGLPKQDEAASFVNKKLNQLAKRRPEQLKQ